MAVTQTSEAAGLRRLDDFEEAHEVWPRGERLEALRAAAIRFKRRFRQTGQVRAVRTFDLASSPYPVKMALGGAAISPNPNPYVNLVPRMLVVQFEDFEGALRTLLWGPMDIEGAAESPFYAQLTEQTPDWLQNVLADIRNPHPGDALARTGLRPEDVDFAAFDHLHVQDMRRLLGTTEPVDGRPEPWPPAFPNARWICQRKEVDTFSAPHPMQWAWYVQGGMDAVVEDNLVVIDEDVELGRGVALIRTPGHTDGNQSLVVNTPEGIWVSSENGVCMDNWQPELSKIPGVRKHAEFFKREVILNSNTLEDSVEQYDSMVVERTIADTNRRDPRWLNIFPSSEMAAAKRSWPVVPTFVQAGLSYGELRTP